tara:strand:+ start:806 stop:1627 length:822 start_codon:yes stop_codon:yes gene_type:complete
MSFLDFGGSSARDQYESDLARARSDMQNFERQFQNFEFDVENPYEDLENVYEDMTVNLQAARFSQQALAQQQANILQGLRGAAGESGAAGLATALSRQAATATQQMAIDIGEQEQAIEKMQADYQAQIDQMIRGADFELDVRQQQLEFDRLQTMYGMSMEEVASIRNAEAQRQAGNKSLFGQILGAGAQIAGFALIASDRDYKKNIKKIGKSPSGINIYQFEYKDKSRGEGVYQGVISDDLPASVRKKAIKTGKDGNDVVDYNIIDVEFKRIK